MRHLAAIVTALSFFTVACGNSSQPENSQSSVGAPSAAPYTVINTSARPGIKRTIDVRLKRKELEGTLRVIANKLKSQDARKYDRTFISYYLPGMEVGSGAWATTHFDPDLEVRILGPTEAEGRIVIRRLAEKQLERNREVIGRWLDHDPSGRDSIHNLGGRITIFRSAGKIFFEQNFKDGGTYKTELVWNRESPAGRRFDKVKRSRAGDHWIIGHDGNLQAHDDQGLISTSKKIK